MGGGATKCSILDQQGINYSILYCIKCGAWTAQGGRPKILVQGCNGRGPRPVRILNMAVEDRILPFMRIKEWPNPSNRPGGVAQ
eukprot:1607412-Karenia_brevis.AAC.1